MPSPAGRPNLLILLLDSVPARRLGCYGYSRPTTPNIDRLAAEGLRFAEMVSTGSQSPPSHASLFTGLYPDRHHVLVQGARLPEAIPTLAETLKSEGYRTCCISNKPDVGHETGMSRGFDRTIEMFRRFSWPLSGMHFRLMRGTMNFNGRFDDGAEESNRRMTAFIDEAGAAPFFGFINYVDAHYPYGAPRPYRYRYFPRPLSYRETRRLFSASLVSESFGRGEFELSADDLEAMSRLFDGGVAYLDARIGSLAAGLRSRGLLDRTLLVVLSDHGEYLGEHGRIGHGQGLYESVLRIPVILRLPGKIAPGRADTRPAQICDLFPTILGLLGAAPGASAGVDGRNLLDGGASPVREGNVAAFYPGMKAFRKGSLKYIVSGSGAEELYDLGADPGEKNNLVPARPEETARLREALGSFLDRGGSPAGRRIMSRTSHDPAEPVYALGINYYDHDSAVALARDGRIVYAIAEERLSRVKKDWGFPQRSIQAALDHAGIGYGDLAQVCFGWQKPGASYAHDLKCYLSGSIPASWRYLSGSSRRFLRELSQSGGQKNLRRDFGAHPRPVRFVDHHYAHALSTYLLSGYSDASVLIVDGRGAWEATTMWKAGGGDCVLMGSHSHPDSLGFLYAAFTSFLGFRPNSDEWKVMGLAPYGKPGVDLSRYASLNGNGYKVEPRLIMGDFFGDVRAIEADFGRKREAESEITQRDKDIAWAVQDFCEEAMIRLASGIVKKTGVRKLCLAGGVAMNSKANGKILEKGICDEIFIQPAATDDGTAIGAALAAAKMSGGPAGGYRLEDVYLGPEYGDDEIESLLRTFKIQFTRPADITEEAAKLLASGKIVGWFQGRMEFGPRALGNRSILADPRDASMKDKVNAVVKFREGWRPFAPSVLKDRASEFFTGCTDSPYMILTFPVREAMKSVIPAITHVDGSARVQTVTREANPKYYSLIERFGRITGVPVVMNTSFNLREEPIVCAPRDAIRTFYSSGLDALCLGSFLILK